MMKSKEYRNTQILANLVCGILALLALLPFILLIVACLLYTSPSPRDPKTAGMPSSA